MGRLSQESAWRIASWLSWKGKEMPVGGAGGGCSLRFLQPRWLRPLPGWAPDHGITKQTSKLAATPSELHLLRRSEEHTSELQSRGHLVCRLLLEKKNKTQ